MYKNSITLNSQYLTTYLRCIQSDKERIKQLEAQLKESQKQAKYEKLKREAYETMIDIAEEEFNIKIEKKPGARQSKK